MKKYQDIGKEGNTVLSNKAKKLVQKMHNYACENNIPIVPKSGRVQKLKQIVKPMRQNASDVKQEHKRRRKAQEKNVKNGKDLTVISEEAESSRSKSKSEWSYYDEEDDQESNPQTQTKAEEKVVEKLIKFEEKVVDIEIAPEVIKFERKVGEIVIAPYSQ